MKIRERISKSWKKKGFRYGAAGTLCLAAAAGMFGMSINRTDVGASATTIEGLTKVNGVYQITSGSDFALLRDATVDASNSFELTQDISLEITDTADGTFSGIFNGNGYVIKVTSVDLPDSAQAGTVSEGILFGTVNGTVENLIVDVQDTVEYTRTSKVERSDSLVSENVEVNGNSASATYTGTSGISQYKGNTTEKNLAKKLDALEPSGGDVFYVLQDGTVTTQEPVSGTFDEYRREKKTENIIKTNTYNSQAIGEDSFGVLCGTLTETGTLQNVYVKGQGVTAEQNATQTAMTTTQSGSRDAYFYYKVNRNVHEENEQHPVTGSVNASSVNVYNSVQGDAVSDSDDNAELDVTVTPVKYIEKNGTVTYTVGVKNNTDSEISVNITPAGIPSGGTWTNGSSGNLMVGANTTYDYTLTNVTSDINGHFEISYTDSNLSPILVSTAEVATTVVDTTLLGTSNSGSGELLLTLTPAKTNYIVKNTDTSVFYELTIKNNIALASNASGVKVMIDKEDITATGVKWYIKDTTKPNHKGEEFSSIVIEKNQSSTLIGEMSVPVPGSSDYNNSIQLSVSVTPSVQTNIYDGVASYTYAANPWQNGMELPQYGTSTYQGNLTEVPDTYTANHLSAGVFAGISSGAITSAKQDMAITGSKGVNVPSGVSLNVGGAVGKAADGASADSLYLKGTSTYTGSGTLSPTNSAVSSTTTMPSGGFWAEYYNGTSSNAMFDLAWLIKKEDSSNTYFTYADTPVSNTIPVTVSSSGRELASYAISYNARKAIADTSEDHIYLASGNSGTPALALGDSGYYRVLNAYATDGYYHYCTDKAAIADAVMIYPYENDPRQNPFTTLAWSVVRIDDHTAEDVIRVTGFPGTAEGGLVYYAKNTDAIPSNVTSSKPLSITNGQVDIPFDESKVSYRIVPVAEDHIYPTIPALSEPAITYNADDRLPIEKPTVEYQNGYTADGTEEYLVFAGNPVLEVGDKLKISTSDIENGSSYSYKYLLSEAELGGTDWDGDRYIGTDAIMAGAHAYSESLTLDSTGDFYLYVQVTRKNYKDQIYRIGKLTVEENSVVIPTVYYTEGTPSNIAVGGEIVDGDLLKISCENKSLKYDISYEEKTSGYTWKSYTPDSCFELSSSGNKDEVFVYVAVASADCEYDSIESFRYTFAEPCSPVNVNPNTAQEIDGTTGAASIESGSTVRLSSRTSDALILYAAPENNVEFSMDRVQALPDGITNSGDEAGSYTYYKVGERWYRTTLKSLQEYDDTEPILMSHSDTSSKIMRIYTVALKAGLEPGAVRKYVYSVEEPHRVADPEASLKTRKTSDSTDIPMASIELGAYLTFPSMTPGATVRYRLPGESEWNYVKSEGIKVTGSYGGNFTVSVQAQKAGMLDSNIVTYEYMILPQEITSSVTATPATSTDNPTVIMPGNKILLSSTTKGAVIYYTTDGSSPVLNADEEYRYTPAEGTLVYAPENGITMPEATEGFFTISAVAAKDGLAKSEELHLVYTYPDAVLSPYPNVAQGNVAFNTEVQLKNKTEDAIIYYNTAYGDAADQPIAPPTISSAVFDEGHPFVITQKTKIIAIAVKNGVKSNPVTLIYTPMDILAVPTASIESGSVVSRGTVLTLKAEKGATIFYTMDGSDPTDDSNAAIVSGNTVSLNGEAGGQITIKAYAAAENRSRSEVATFTYQFSQSAGGVTADIPSGSEVSNGDKVNLMTDVTDADIYYTTDGSDPVEDGKKGTAVTISGVSGSTITIKAVAVVDDEAGMVSSFTYKIKEIPNAPTATPAGGILTVAARVVLDSGAAKIYYTTDGTTPTENSLLYSEPVLINRTTTLKAIAVSEDGEISAVASWQYVAAAEASAPKANVDDQQVLDPGTIVFLRTDTSNADIYYTTDGTEPALDNLDRLDVYDSSGITIKRSVTIKAAAYREDLQLSDVSVWNYVVEKIPAVEIRQQEAAKLAEEGLKDSDSSGLDRAEIKEGTSYQSRVLKEKEYNTVVSSAWESIDPRAVLVTESTEISSAAINNTRKLFGDDYTVLASYDMKLIVGSTYVKPEGEVEIGVPIPDGYENAVLTIANVDSGHRLKTYDTRRSDGMLYAMTDQMDHYVVIGPENEEVDSREFPYLLLLEIMAGMTGFAGIMYFVFVKIKKHFENH